MADNDNKLHWTQRIALVRHNLHAASRSGDFTFFKTLQAAGFMEGTNHVAALSVALDDEADTVMAAMDHLNAGLAYAHQDAFKVVYDSMKTILGQEGEDKKREARCKLFVDASMQRNIADMAIDKTTSSAINLINQQPVEAQEAATNVWVTGMTIIVDAIDVTLRQLDALETRLDDFIRMEESWNIVKSSVVCAITGLKGVFELMDPNLPFASKSSPRNSSIASASASVFRRLSNAFTPSAANSRTPSVASLGGGPPLSSPFAQQHGPTSLGAPVYRTPNFRSGGAKTAGHMSSVNMPAASSNWTQHKLTTIPPTPAFEDSADPFDTTAAPKRPGLPSIRSDHDQEMTAPDAGGPFDSEIRTSPVLAA